VPLSTPFKVVQAVELLLNDKKMSKKKTVPGEVFLTPENGPGCGLLRPAGRAAGEGKRFLL
jgi:hypothetical protein